MELDRSSPVPLWAQLEAELRRQIADGRHDSHFPGEADLVVTYGVSRQTVREALRRLADDGMIERQRGRGTRVVTERFAQSLGALYSLYASIEASGGTQTSEVLELGITRADEAAAQLGLAADADLVVVARRRNADGEPLAIDRAWLPASVASPLLDADFTHTALYDELESRCGLRPDNGWERIRPAVPDEEQRRLLELPADAGVFAIERIGRVGSQVVEWRQSIVRGDRYEFVADWAAGSAPDLRLAHIRSTTG